MYLNMPMFSEKPLPIDPNPGGGFLLLTAWVLHTAAVLRLR
jgi:hypothetical protein